MNVNLESPSAEGTTQPSVGREPYAKHTLRKTHPTSSVKKCKKLSPDKSAIYEHSRKIIRETLAQDGNPLYFCTRFREGTLLRTKAKT